MKKETTILLAPKCGHLPKLQYGLMLLIAVLFGAAAVGVDRLFIQSKSSDSDSSYPRAQLTTAEKFVAPNSANASGSQAAQLRNANSVQELIQLRQLNGWSKDHEQVYACLKAKLGQSLHENDVKAPAWNSEKFSVDDRLYLTYYFPKAERDNEQLAWQALTGLLPVTMVAIDTDKVQEIVKQIGTLQKEFKSSPSIATQVRLMSWLLLLGELTSDDDTRTLWQLSVDSFEQGFEQFAAIETQIGNDPSLEKEISKIPAVAVRLDGVRVRKVNIEKRQALARKQEHDRIDQLRTLVRSFRDLTQAMVLADSYFIQENYQAAANAHEQVLQSLQTVYDTALTRRDFYLLSDEPQLGEDKDFVLLQTPADPFSKQMISAIKSLKGLIALRLASQSPGAPDQKLLLEAQEWSQSALKANPAQPMGPLVAFDEDNLLAHYVLGLTHELLGVNKTSPKISDPEARQAAAPEFAQAKVHLERARTLLNPAQQPLQQFATEIGQRLEQLNGVESAIAAAALETHQGNPAAAVKLLRKALTKHSTPSLWLAYVEGVLRSRENYESTLKELSEAIAAKSLDEQMPETALVTSKLGLALAWREHGQGLDQNAIRQRVQGHEQSLRSAICNMPALHPRKPECEALLGLAISYQAAMGAADTPAKESWSEGYRLARDAAISLEMEINKAPAPLRLIELREALVNARLAMGHLAVKILPNYRDEALLAFASAYDELAKLPFAQGDLKILGTPMIRAVVDRSDASGQKMASEERNQRQKTLRFIEGAISLWHGNPVAASDSMETALNKIKSTDGVGSELTAAQMLADTDGLETPAALQETLLSYKSLSDSAAGRAERAVRELLGIDDLETLTAAKAGQYLQSTQSPLTSYALAMALESYTVSLPFTFDSVRRLELLGMATLAQKRTTELLQSSSSKSRYPHLVSLNNTAQKRLVNSDEYIHEAKTQRGTGDQAGALAQLEAGLKRHPQDQALWNEVLALKVQATQSSNDPESLATLLQEIQVAESNKIVSPYLIRYYRAHILERQGHLNEAIALLQEALQLVEEPTERVRVRSRLATLKSMSFKQGS